LYLCSRKGLKIFILRGVGAGAVSQMTKATIISKGVLAQKGVNLRIDPSFQDIPSRKEEGKTITAILYKLELRDE
jgi:stage V sporulation protein SpoVS